jgi:hypothetical protein
MPGIEDQYEAIEKQHIDESNPYFKPMLEVFGEFVPLVGLLYVIQKQFSPDAAMARIKALVEQLVIDIQRHEKKLGKVLDIQSKIDSPEIAETVLATINETIRTTNVEKIKRFAAILGHSLTKEKATNWDDAAAYIRDIAQLGDRDIKALEILYSVQKDLFLGKNLAYEPNEYTERNAEVLKLAHESGMPRDEFYSRCGRLNGFGLAIEVQRNEFRVSPGDHCFRLTTRGRELISILSG